MTIIGKILTFLIFFVSIVFLGFAITINVLNKDPKTRQSWVDVAREYRDKIVPALQKDLETKDKEIADLRSELANLTRKMAEEQKKAKAQIDQAEDRAFRAQTERDTAVKNFEDKQSAVTIAINELTQRRQEVLTLHEQIKQQNITIANQQAEMAKLTNEKIQLEAKANTLQDRLNQLQRDYLQLVKEREAERERGTAGIATPVAGGQDTIARYPPPEDIQGRVLEVTPDGLVELSVGSDHGLMRGHTLEVFRLHPKPQYLGVVKIVEVTQHRSVGQLVMPQARTLVKRGDLVANRIMTAGPQR